MVTGSDWDTVCLSAIASAHCAQQVSLPSAELELMVHIREFSQGRGGGKRVGQPSASVRRSQEFLRIWTRPPLARLCCGGRVRLRQVRYIGYVPT